ncbi:MAG TPA: hypothetical protein PKD43_18335, partial [Nitrospira sp.]|nr:hypothetical protein [Nitrospira sp.]
MTQVAAVSSDGTRPSLMMREGEGDMKLTGSEILIECLKAEGVKTIFALPGGVVLKIFDMLHQ